MADEKTKIAPEQLDRMLRRYAKTLDEHFQIMGETFGDRALELARGAIDAALLHVGDDPASAQHLTGFVQGVLLCKGLATWEYLASDDRRS